MTSYIDEYHKHYEGARIWEKNLWFEIPMWKLPFDAFVIQELIVRVRPQFIIELGTGCGGSAMFYASICELLGYGNVITCDIELKYDIDKINKYHWSDRIIRVHGSSNNRLVINRIYEITGKAGDSRCMVILDSWHTKEHVYKEMLNYSPLVSVDSYMIVEDTHVNGNPVPWEYDDEGPMGAINKWLKMHDGWEVDYSCEKHLMTFNPKGYLRRVS